MMILGNILLLLGTLIFFGLLSLLYHKVPSGDAGVGYAWSLIFLNLAFIVCMIVLALIIGAKGGFAWVSESRSSRFFWVSGILAAALFTLAWTALMKNEHGPVPGVIRFLSGFAPVLIPVVLIASGAILLNTSLRTGTPEALYKWPLLLVGVISITCIASGILGIITASAKKQEARLQQTQEDLDQNQVRMLRDIDSCDVTKDMVMILVLTDENQHPQVRSKAVAKVKTHPDWQGELIRRLQTPWASEVFTFLASNEVDDPTLFGEPIRQGVLIQANIIRQRIRDASHPSHFYPELFYWEVERVLRTVDRYQGQGVDYLQAIKNLHAALSGPSEFEKPKFKCSKLLEEWMEKHS